MQIESIYCAILIFIYCYFDEISESNPGTIRALRESSHPTIVNSSRPEPPVQENSAQAGRLSQRRGGSSNVHTLRGNDEDPSQGKNTYWNGNSTQFGGNDEAKED